MGYLTGVKMAAYTLIPHLEYSLPANLAGWDSESRSQGREETEMTFTYAVIADGGIVLVADSQVTHTHSDQRGGVIGTYKGRQGKIRRIGRFAFSISGKSGLIDTLLAGVDETEVARLGSFDEIVRTYQRAFQQVLSDKYPDAEQRLQVRNFGVAFLFCGFTKQTIPQVVKLDIAGDFLWDPITGRSMAATGAKSHGAAYYLHHRLYREGMPLEQAKLLAYCAAAEVADQDNSVGGPIEVEVITPDGSHAMTEEDINKYEAARQEIVNKVTDFVGAFK